MTNATSVVQIDSHRIESQDGSVWAVRRDTISRNRKHYNTMWYVKTRVNGKATVIAGVVALEDALNLVASRT